MSLITILLALAFEHTVRELNAPRIAVEWFARFLVWFGQRWGKAFNSSFGVFLALSLPALAVGIIYLGVDYSFGLFGLAFAVLVLTSALGYNQTATQVDDLLDMLDRGDEEGARYPASELLGRTVHDSGPGLVSQVVDGLLVQAHERIFGVLFWFVLLGPAGAALFRLACVLRDQVRGGDDPLARSATHFHWLLSWVPARFTALAYAVAGSYTHAMEHWSEENEKGQDSNTAILITAGKGALTAVPPQPPVEDPIDETWSLIKRALVVWITVVALFTVGGWIG